MSSIGKTGSGKCFQLVSTGPIIVALSVLYVSCSSIACLIYINPNKLSFAFIFPLTFGLSLEFVCICIYLKLALGGCGYVPLNWTPSREEDKIDYCKICKGYKPPRCHHCRRCNRCVILLDHHCPFINACVGYFNRRIFISFNLITFLTSLFVMFSIGFPFLYKNCLSTSDRLDVNLNLLFSGFINFGCLFVMAGFSLILFVLQIANCVRNTSLVEGRIKRQIELYSQLRLQNPFDLGWKKNISITLFEPLEEFYENWKMNERISTDRYYLTRMKVASRIEQVMIMASSYQSNLVFFFLLDVKYKDKQRKIFIPPDLWLKINRNNIVKSLDENQKVKVKLRIKNWMLIEYQCKHGLENGWIHCSFVRKEVNF